MLLPPQSSGALFVIVGKGREAVFSTTSSAIQGCCICCGILGEGVGQERQQKSAPSVRETEVFRCGGGGKKGGGCCGARGAANGTSASSPWEGLVGVREWEWWVGVLSTNQLGKQRDGGINKG